MDVISMLLFMIITTLWAIFLKVHLCILILPPLFIHYGRRIFRWVLFLMDSRKNITQTIVTKSYVYNGRYGIYELDITKKIHYSIIKFNDPSLKGEYIDLNDDIYRNGDTLEIVFYKRSKVIKSITKIGD